MHFPVWIDLKGQDSVPETVHHVVCHVDPIADQSWKSLMQTRRHIQTDGVHMKDGCGPNDSSAGPSHRGAAFSCVCLHSDRNPAERKANLQKFKNTVIEYNLRPCSLLHRIKRVVDASPDKLTDSYEGHHLN
ncbi:unnamed protein product [Echinostoma caproni]|uniref:START domain-containing protein n=1 Tax=Echinostoma caproni TaxID=27848 RepID=A0A183AWC8_9TREM|nr:unnamed protein product [Echinostoma caproni]